MSAGRPHACDPRCERIRQRRTLGWTYERIGAEVGVTGQRVQQILVAHVRQRTHRDGPSWCVTCQRHIHPTLRTGWILAADVACGWCARRWDGGLYVTPALRAVFERSELHDLVTTQESAQRLRVDAKAAQGLTGQSFEESET